VAFRAYKEREDETAEQVTKDIVLW
jgi:hypothetical protein